MGEQPIHETPKAASAFAEYCEMGAERSLAKLAQKWGKNRAYVGQLERWSSAYGWVERVKLYDAERTEEKRRKRDEAIEAMNERHALIGTTQQRRAIEQIERLIKAEKFGSQASVQLLKMATDLERLARGAPTEHTEVSGGTSIAEWYAIRATIIEVLSAFPDARIAVAAALAQLGG